jgi:MOSC domain-containing protein YiiM
MSGEAMRVIAVNVGRARPIANAKSSGVTGIYKEPQTGPVPIGPLGLAHDSICDTENHGGPDQAVYVFGTPDYAWWENELGRTLEPGTFGENLTITGLESAAFSLGDRLKVGGVLLEVTGARIPCVTLAARMGDPAFVKRFRFAERPGLYCRVIETGEVQAGDPVSAAPTSGPTENVITLFREFYAGKQSADRMRYLLTLPIDIRSRNYYEQELAKLTSAAEA